MTEDNLSVGWIIIEQEVFVGSLSANGWIQLRHGGLEIFSKLQPQTKGLSLKNVSTHWSILFFGSTDDEKSVHVTS